MKKIFSLMALLLMVCSTAHAQYMMKVQMKDGYHCLFEVDCTEKVMWEELMWDPGKIDMSVSGRMVGWNNTWDMGFPTDMIESVTIVGQDSPAPETEQSVFEVDEQTTSVNMVNYSIEFGPSAIEGQKTLTVNRVDNASGPEDIKDGINYMITYDFDLEGIHDLNGVAEIRIPVTKKCFAAYKNTKTNKWEPVLSYYDYKTREMVIITDHLSTYSVFDVNNEHKRTAMLEYSGFDPTRPIDIQKVAETFAKVAKDDDPNYAAIDAFANKEFTLFNLGIGWYPALLEDMGFKKNIFSKSCDVLGKMGTAWSIVQFGNLLRTGDTHEITLSAVKLIVDTAVKPAIEKKLVGCKFIFSASMTAWALLDFELQYFREQVETTVKDLYQNAYRLYFSREGGYPHVEGYGYRSATEWYNLIAPLFLDSDMSQEEITQRIDEMVKEYINQPWHDTDGYNEALSDCRGSWPFWVELREKGRKEITENHRKELYSGVLKSVITNINRKYMCKAHEELNKIYEEYAQMMNMVVYLRFKDSSVKQGEKSKFAGCKIRFAEIPSTILDPQKWECTVKDDGTGIIQFRMYPYVTEGFKPELEVVDANDIFVGNIDIQDIQDAGRFYEATFDLSNKEDMDLKDKWNITLDPVLVTTDYTPEGTPIFWGPIVQSDSTGIGSLQRGIVPGDVYGIYEGITEALEDRTLNIDEEGNFSIKNNHLTLTGHFNARTGLGTGKFTLKTSSSGSGFMTEHEAFDDWVLWSRWVNSGKPEGEYEFNGELVEKYEFPIWNGLRSFDADFSVEGTVEIYYSELMQCYSLHLDGIGTFRFSGDHYLGPKNAYWELNTEGKWVLHYSTRDMNTDDLDIKDGSIIFSPTLIYE